MTINYEKRFWEQVNKQGACWRWMGKTTAKGYGAFYASVGRTKFYKAHGYSWYLHNGLSIGGMWVLHKCDNPWCVNPDHLFLGKNRDNMVDKVTKGRHNKGESHGRAKLTEDDVRAIRASDETNEVLGKRFGVHPAHISGIQSGRAWKHLDPAQTGQSDDG